MNVADIVEGCELAEVCEWVYQIGYALESHGEVATVFEGYFVAAGFDSYVGLHIFETQDELGHADGDGVLANLGHVVKVELEHSLEFEFILEIVDHAGCVA